MSDAASPASLPLKKASRPPRSYVARTISSTVAWIAKYIRHCRRQSRTAPMLRAACLLQDLRQGRASRRVIHTLLPVMICILIDSKGAVAVLLMAPA
jgi:hypothetical protein